MKFIHLFLLMSLFGLNACTVDVPDLYTGDFRCHDDYDCADDFYCDTYSDPTGDSFCRAHDTPDDPNTDSCDTSNCAFPYHCNGDHCQDDPDACSSWNQGGDCPGTQADCWSGICVDHNYSCSDSYGENPLECGDSTIECHLNGVCTNSDGQECIPNNGDSAHKDCQEFHGSDSFCMAQPVCDNGTNPDGCEDNADCAYPFVCEYNSCTQDMSACAYNGSFCPNSGNCINGACYEAGAEDCDTTTCTSGCTANGYCAGGSPEADPCDITDSTEHALCRTQLGNDQSYCTAYLECEVDMSGCGFPYIDDGNGACIPDTNACIMTNWDGDCPTSSEYCNRGVCTTHTFDCYVGLNELCTNDKYCDPHGSCALSSGYECDPTDPAAHSLCQTETVNMDSYCISNPACDREPIGCASMEDCYLAGFGDNFACFDGTCQPRCVAGQNGACPPNYECKDIDLDTDFVEYACVAATSGTYCLHDPNTICTAPGTQCMMSQICMDYANDTHGQCGPMGECPDYNVCVSQDGCYPGTVYDWNDTVTGEFRHDYAIYCDAIANCPEGHHCVYDDLGQTVCRPECFESACNSYLDMNCTSMLSIDDTNLHYVCMKDHDACAEAEWVWTNMNSDTGNLVNHNEEYEPLQGIGFSADGFPFKVVTNGNIIGLLGKDSSGNTRLWMDYFDNQSSGAAFEKLITISSRDSWVSHPVISPNSDSIAIMCDNFAIFGGSTGTACFNLGAPDDSVLALVDFSAASPDTKIYTAATTPHLKEVYYGLAYNGQTIAMSLTTDNTPANPFIARVSADGNFSAIGPTINKYPSVNAEAIPVFQSDSTMFWVAASSDDSTSWGYPDTLHFTDFDDPTNDGKVAFSLSDIRNIINMQASKNVVLLNTYDYQVASDNFQLGFITQTPDTHNLSGITSNRVGPMGWTGMPKMERFADLKIAVMNEHIVVWARETSESDGFQLMASDLRACTRGALSAEMPGSFVIAEQRDSAFCGGKEATLESFDVVADSLGGFALVYAAACKDGTNYVSHKIFTRRFSGQPPQL